MRHSKQHFKLHRMVMIAVFCALAYVAMIVINIKVSFLTLDIKDAIITLCGLYFGPVAAVLISVIVPLLEFITISETGVYGLIMNILGSLAFSLTASLFYRWNKRLWNAVWGLIAAVLVMTALMLVANLLITPYFMKTTVEFVQNLIPSLFLPFNLLKGAINAGAVLLLYKPMSRALHRVGILQKTQPVETTRETAETKQMQKSLKTSILVTVTAILLIAGALVLIFTALGGKFVFGK